MRLILLALETEGTEPWRDGLERLREFMSRLSTGWDVQTVQEIVADALHNIVDPLVYAEAVRLIAEHHQAGHDVIIVSTSGSEVVDELIAKLRDEAGVI